MKILLSLAMIINGFIVHSQIISEYKFSEQHTYKSGDSINAYGPLHIAEGSFISVYTSKRFKGRLKSSTHVNKGSEWKKEYNRYFELEDYRNNYFGPIKDFIVFKGDTLARVKSKIGLLFIDIRKGIEYGELFHKGATTKKESINSSTKGLVDEYVRSINDSLFDNDKLSLLWYKFGPEEYSNILKDVSILNKKLSALGENSVSKLDSVSYFSLEYEIKASNYNRGYEGFKVFSKGQKYDVQENGSLVIKDQAARAFLKSTFNFHVKEDVYIKVKEAKVVDALTAIRKSDKDEKIVRIVIGFKVINSSLERSIEDGFPPQFSLTCDVTHASLWLGKAVPVFIGRNP